MTVGHVAFFKSTLEVPYTRRAQENESSAKASFFFFFFFPLSTAAIENFQAWERVVLSFVQHDSPLNEVFFAFSFHAFFFLFGLFSQSTDDLKRCLHLLPLKKVSILPPFFFPALFLTPLSIVVQQVPCIRKRSPASLSLRRSSD